MLKNDSNLLPLNLVNHNAQFVKSIAVIGPDAKAAVISGGGSASLAPSYTVTPFDAITEVAHEVLGLKPESIKYARSGNAHKWTPLFVGPNIPSSSLIIHGKYRDLSCVARTVNLAWTVRGTTRIP